MSLGITSEHEIRQRYFLLSKRWSISLILLALVIYSCAVVWSEFVFSVSTTSPDIAKKWTAQLKRLGCPRDGNEIEEKDYAIPRAKLASSRSPWFLDKTRHFGYYIDFLDSYPGCIASWILLSESGVSGVPPGSTIYFYDRTSGEPIVKITIESIEKR